MWLVYTLIATLLYGVMNFVNKVAVERGYSAPVMVAVSAATVSTGCLLALLLRGTMPAEAGLLIFFACLNGFFYGSGHLAKLAALRRAPAGVVFPLDKFNVLFVIVIGVLWFGDRPTGMQAAGMVLAVAVLVLLARQEPGERKTAHAVGVLLALLAAGCTALSMTAGKLAAERVDKTGYMFVSYTLVFGYALLLARLRLSRPALRAALTDRRQVAAGMLIGLLNGVGYYCILHAFAAYQLALIQPVFALSILIPIILSAMVYHEHLNTRRWVAIVLALLAVILIKAGG